MSTAYSYVPVPDPKPRCEEAIQRATTPLTIEEIGKLAIGASDRFTFGVGEYQIKYQGRVIVGYGGKTYFSSPRNAKKNLAKVLEYRLGIGRHIMDLRGFTEINHNYYQTTKYLEPHIITYRELSVLAEKTAISLVDFMVEQGIVTVEQIQ